MYKSIKLKNDTFWDTISGVHRRTNLQTVIDNLLIRDYITEIGSNNNGTYIKWANGLMICHNHIRLTLGNQRFTTAYGSVYYNGNTVDWTYPKEFIDPPTVVGTAYFQGGLGGYNNTAKPTTTKSSGYLFHSLSYNFDTADGRVGVDLIAIGKWK